MESCNEFVYLGMVLYFNSKCSQTQKSLSEQGRKAVYSLFDKIQDGCYNIETLLSLFDTYVKCILNYGCEVYVIKLHQILKRSIYIFSSVY